MDENAEPIERLPAVDASGWPVAALANIGNGHNGKFDKQKKIRYLELLADGIGRVKASKDVGIHIVTVERHLNKNQAFRDACSLAEMEADEEVENALFEAARSGNVAAAFGWLYNRQPDKWQDRRNSRAERSLIQLNQQNVMAGGVTFADLLREATNGDSRTVEGERGAADPNDALALEPPEGESPALA